MDLTKALVISSQGWMHRQPDCESSQQNLANQNTTADKPGAEPYRRKTVSFDNTMEAQVGVATVRVKQISTDKAELPASGLTPRIPQLMHRATSKCRT